jgi:hypothetical protein
VIWSNGSGRHSHHRLREFNKKTGGHRSGLPLFVKVNCASSGLGSITAAAATAAATATVTPAAATPAATTTTAATEATAATTTAAATTTTTAVTTTTATTTAGAIFTGFGFVHGQRTAVMFLAVQCRDGSLSFFIGPHLDESESLAATGFAVADDFCAGHGAVLRKQLFQIRASRRIAEISDV